jgi:hypothetical protein
MIALRIYPTPSLGALLDDHLKAVPHEERDVVEAVQEETVHRPSATLRTREHTATSRSSSFIVSAYPPAALRSVMRRGP